MYDRNRREDPYSFIRLHVIVQDEARKKGSPEIIGKTNVDETGDFRDPDFTARIWYNGRVSMYELGKLADRVLETGVPQTITLMESYRVLAITHEVRGTIAANVDAAYYE